MVWIFTFLVLLLSLLKHAVKMLLVCLLFFTSCNMKRLFSDFFLFILAFECISSTLFFGSVIYPWT